MPFSRFQYILMLVEALGLLNWTICSYTSVIISPLEQEKKSHLQLEKNSLFFFLIVLFECGLKTYEKYHLSSSRMRTSLFIHLKYTAQRRAV